MDQKRFVELKNKMHLIRQKDLQLSVKVDARAINDESQYCKNCGSRLGIDCGEAEADYDTEFCSVGCHDLKYRDNTPNYKELHASDLPIYRKWVCGNLSYYYRGRIVNGRVVCDKISIGTNECSYTTLSLTSVMAGDNTECNETEFNNAICKLITYLEK